MKILNNKLAFRVTWVCVFFLLIAALPGSAAEIDDGLAKCAGIKDDNAARLKCFDDLAKQQTSAKDASLPSDVAATVPKEPAKESKPASLMSKQWDLDVAKENLKGTFFKLKPYRPIYFLPIAYNSSPNEDTALDFDKNAKAQYNEAKFQISFKVKPWGTDIEYIKGIKGIDVWFAYTQLAFWQLYNSALSSPLRDINYEPELLINFRTDYSIPGFDDFKVRYFNLGFNHQSNGRSVPLSRSWNRIVANAGLEKNNFNLLLKTWYRIPEEKANDDNPDISRYMGYGELWGIYSWRGNRFAAMLRNNFRQDNLGAIQLDWSIPLSMIHKELGNRFSFYVQYFNGYGEGLLDYNKSINRISVGFMLADWN